MVELQFNNQQAVLTFPQELLAEEFVKDFLAQLKAKSNKENNGWPPGYFDNFGQWEGMPLERPEQLPLENRLAIE